MKDTLLRLKEGRKRGTFEFFLFTPAKMSCRCSRRRACAVEPAPVVEYQTARAVVWLGLRAASSEPF